MDYVLDHTQIVNNAVLMINSPLMSTMVVYVSHGHYIMSLACIICSFVFSLTSVVVKYKKVTGYKCGLLCKIMYAVIIDLISVTK